MGDALEQSERLFAEGEAFADEEADDEALALFRAAWEALPEPRGKQEPAVRILAAIADSHLYLGNWEECRQAVQIAFQCGAEPEHPFLRLRLGQALFELGELAEATNWLAPLYLTEGLAPFEGEDPKYLASFRSRLDPPPGGWPEGW
jgi:tetratricopeptide (TPR) repeat protein